MCSTLTTIAEDDGLEVQETAEAAKSGDQVVILTQDHLQSEIWNNEKFKEIRKNISEYNPPELCKNCLVLQKPGRLESTTFIPK